jgi:3-methyladenine DNA glycosylase AlkD
MANPFHQDILKLIRKNSGTPTQHTFVDSYLGNGHPRYPINVPTLRTIAKTWMQQHRELSAIEFAALLTSLVEGKSSTEKSMAGILLDHATPAQCAFDPNLFDQWLDHLVGWAEVDSLCTGKYTTHQISIQWKKWKPILKNLAKSKNIQKRRASIVLLCSPLSKSNDEALALAALENIERLKSEKEILITKAISWVLRSMIKYHKQLVAQYIDDNAATLPSIAVRETRMKLKTGKKTKIAM